MRVLMVHSFHHPRGGDTTYTRDLTRLLADAGDEVIPLAMRHPDNDPSIWARHFPSWVDLRANDDPVARGRAALRMLWSAEAARACRRLVSEARPDIAHIQHVHRHLTPSVLRPLRRAGVPVVWTVHDYELICPSAHLYARGAACERCADGRYRHAVETRCKWGSRGASLAVAAEKRLHRWLGVWAMVDRFLCPSAHLARTLVRFGVPADRVQHLENFLDLTHRPPGDSPGEGWLYAGRLSEEKGVQVAIEAARRLPGVPLYIYGDGPMRNTLERQAADLPWVRFLGHRPRPELAARLAAVRAVVVPSLWPENFPYAVLEAQAAARAVVASDIGGIPEQITHGRDGLLFPPGDAEALARAVRHLLTDPARARQLGAAARTRVESRLQPADHLRRLRRVYAEVAR
ncbi:MAG: glycosyltransferase [Deltaproteobacteria bacterium]|nr:MAG: glycosyltransferase [Deltaproteobacteria bacterium]